MLRLLTTVGWGRAFTAALLALLASTVATAAAAVPSVGVAPVAAPVGDPVTLHALGLVPNASYTVRLATPSGRELATTVRARADGALDLEIELPEPGPHQLRLIGPAIDALFVVRGLPATDDDEPPAAAPMRPDDPEPDPEPDPDPSDPIDDEVAEEAEAEDEAAPPLAEPPLPTEGLELVAIDAAVVLLEPDGEPRWRFERPAGSGDTRSALLHEGRVWIAHGHTVFEVELERGRVLRRTPLSGPIARLDAAEGGVVATVHVGVAGSIVEVEHLVTADTVSPVPLFDPRSPLFTWWIREADVADPGFALAADDTNPHLHLRVAAAAATVAERDEHVRLALETATTFYDLAHVARGLVAMREFVAADAAMLASLADFEARGYDPGLLTDPTVHDRYGFPLRPMRQAVERGDVDAAGFWAPWLAATAAPTLRGPAATYRAFGDLLHAEGEAEDAAFWREHARGYGRTTARMVVGSAALTLGRGGWYAALALLLATALLHLTLVAKYWRPQSLMLRAARETGQRVGPFARWRFMRYYGLTEKVALLLMLAAAYAVAALAFWVDASDVAAYTTSAGHLEAPFVPPVAALTTGDPGRAALVEGYLLERAGEPERARSRFEVALGRGDPEAAAALAALHAGEQLPAPTPLALREAAAGTWTGAVGRAFTRPFTLARGGEVVPWIAPWAWPAVLVLFLLVAVIHVVVLFVPRPRVARNAPRTPAYHVLTVLVPGSGAADELYGVLLLVPAAVFALDAVFQLFGGASPLGIPLRTSAWILGALYLVNLIAVGIEFASYRRRMQVLRRDQPDLARAYGMRELRAEA